MAVASFRRRSKAITLAPLTVVSGLWTLSLVTTTAVANTSANHPLPGGTSVPNRAIQAPASVPQAGQPANAVPKGTENSVIASASSGSIPAVALAAYQRGAQIIDAADKNCNIPWQLIAAIGRVESDNGQYQGNKLSSKGIDSPGIFGPVLNGKNGTAVVRDTDGGQFDHNTSFDRAVGPMQFIPSTWNVVKVDADGDGQRNPQDINDASLATGVYLCSGNQNLSNRSGQQAAVYRYNHSHSYVNLVLRIMEAYQAGNFSSIPSGSYAGTTFTPSYSADIRARRHAAKVRRAHGGSKTAGAHQPGSSGSSSSSGSGGGLLGGGSSSGTGSGSGSSSSPSSSPSKAVQSTTTKVTKTVQKTTQTVTDLVNSTLAKSMCLTHIGSLLAKHVSLSACTAAVADAKTVAEANATINDLIS